MAQPDMPGIYPNLLVCLFIISVSCKIPLKGFLTKYAGDACIMVGHAVIETHKMHMSYMKKTIMQLYVMTQQHIKGETKC